MIVYLFSIGFISILGQVLLLRELNVAFFGVELIFVLSMGVWLFWTSMGAILGRRAYVPSVGTVQALFFGMALLLPCEIAFIRSIRSLFGAVPGAYLPFGLQLTAILVTLIPVGVLLGLLFQWVAKLYVKEKRTLAMAYAIESVGGIIGGLAATLLLWAGVQNFTSAVVCSLCTAGVLVYPLAGGNAWIRRLGIIVFAGLLATVWYASRIDHRLTAINHPSLIESRDSPYSRISITQQHDQFIVFENDALSFETEGPAAEELVHLAVTNHNDPKRFLVVGGGLDGTINEILKYDPNLVDYVELNPVLVSMVDEHLPDTHRAPLRRENVTVRAADPRRFVADVSGYDVVFVGMPDPTSGQSNRFYTQEFFELCSRLLASNGILSFRLASSENIWTPFVTYRNTSIYHALKNVFRDVVVLPGVANVIIASDTPLERDPTFLTRVFDTRAIDTRMVTSQYIHYLYTNDRFFEITDRLSTTTIAPNTDTRPVCYRYSGMIWLSKFFPPLIHWDTGRLDGRVVLYVFIACLCGVFFLVRRRKRAQRVLLVGAAGFIGMVLETMLILYYQVKSGVLYQNIGILLMVFMAGLAVGSAAILKLTTARLSRGIAGKTLGARLILGFCVLNVVFMAWLHLELPSNLASVSLLLFLSGFLVAGVFAYVSVSGVDDQKLVVSPLYAADLLGGCIGSVIGSLFLVPFLGLEISAGLMVALSLATLILV